MAEHGQKPETLDEHLAHPMNGKGRNEEPDTRPPPEHELEPAEEE